MAADPPTATVNVEPKIAALQEALAAETHVSRVEISRAITAAAQVGGVVAKDEVVCPNRQQNIVIVSTPKRENADKYALVSAYESAPHGRPQLSNSPRRRSATPARKGGHQSRRCSTSRGPRGAGRTPSGDPLGRRRAPTSCGAKGGRSSSRRRGSHSRSRSNSRAESLRRKNAEKQVGWTDRSSVTLACEKEFPRLTKALQPLNHLQIRALMEKMDALASGRFAGAVISNEASGDANTKRKVPRRDPAPLPDREGEPSTSSSPCHEKMDAETLKQQGASLEPSQMQKLQDGLAAQNDMQTNLELLGSKVGSPKHEMVEIESRMEDLSTKLDQQAAKTSSLEAKMRYTDLFGKRRERASTSEFKGAVASRRDQVTSDDDEEEQQ
ncbi:hypothetical protein HPB48_013583 [Haemaphysalis longicornis]|uniref:Uncharacterized protein n=1 Tax=Haemaphysalis longicornis TaxID=44386 RepID=A0A9J6H4G8_HAELO|nr:hypothetical protein HPB48_013583 [Haemaphysalis longicornis]